jgi:hypothetical protein
MQRDQVVQETVSKTTNRGLLTACIFSWIVVVSLVALFSFSITLENFRAEQFVFDFLADRRISVDFPIFMYFLRVFCFAFLTAFAYAAIESTARLRFADQANSYMKLVFFRVSVSEAITFWFIVFFSSSIEYFLLFIPGHTAGLPNFMQNLFGMAIAFSIIRIAKILTSIFRRFLRKKN